MFYFSVTLVFLFIIFKLNKRTGLLIFLLLSLILAISIILHLPKHLKLQWMYDLIGVMVALSMYTFLLIRTDGIMKISFNKLNNKQSIRNGYLFFCIFAGVFISYLFFIKGVIYD